MGRHKANTYEGGLKEDLLNDEVFDECLHTLAASKATSPDDILVEVWLASPAAKAALFNCRFACPRQIIKGQANLQRGTGPFSLGLFPSAASSSFFCSPR